MNRLKICVSDRCFFPKSALMSSRAIAKLAQNLGYEQVEFHPTWVVWFETLTKGELTCQSKDISSFHINWREDGRNIGFGFIKRNFLVPAYYVFPPESWCNHTLQKLEKKYKKPVIVHWQEDFKRYQRPIVELQSFLGIGLRRIEKELKKEKIKGVLIDTDKFAGWLKATGEKEDQSLRRLFPYIKEIHFRFGHKENIDLSSIGKKTNSAKVMKKLVEIGYQGRVVVEMGWPDPGSVEVLRQEGLEKAHQGIVKFLKKL